MTKHITIMNDNTAREVGKAIREGKLAVFRTDTVYGIGTSAFDEEACKRIYEIKQRPINKPLVILISDISMLEKIVEFVSVAERELIDEFWPRPLTILFKKKEGVLPEVVALNTDYIGIRLLDEGIAKELVKAAGVPVVAPSANLAGSPTGTKMAKIMEELDGKVDYILDEGDVVDEMASTIVQVVGEKIVVIREGRIKQEEIERCLAGISFVI